jgi:plastocyanin
MPVLKRIAALAVVPTVACAALAIPALAASTSTIDLGDNFFKPKSATVAKGTTVTWDWTGKAPHNVFVKSGPEKFSSKVQTSGTFKHKMTKSGTYKIVCTIHPGMDLTLKVR